MTRIIGIDFTSRPTRRKPLTVQVCALADGLLTPVGAVELTDFAEFEALLRRPGPWIAGLDFPFGQPRRLVENAGWPRAGADCTAHAASLGRQGFRDALDAYRAPRPAGDKEHLRAVDALAGGVSPQKLYGVPVGLMYVEGAPRLLRAGVHLPAHGVAGDPSRSAVEAYPGVVARGLIGRRGYKNDTVSKQTHEQREARLDILAALTAPAFEARYAFRIAADDDAVAGMADDPGADTLDALLCAVQAAWAWERRASGHGIPPDADPLEGWIADPFVDEATGHRSPPADAPAASSSQPGSNGSIDKAASKLKGLASRLAGR